ncbi:MAG TPA: deoxyribose-phosphate aldolase [Bacteroidales bacterium]|nr:deoxyribose-phosphate aldolase [Bacteroidales bacterium]
MDKITSVLKEYANFNEAEVQKSIEEILQRRKAANHNKKVYETILSCIDLTSLNTTDTEEGIAKMVQKVNDFGENFPELPNVAAICVYPAMVKTVRECLTEGVEIASVAAGFPHSQTFIEVKVAETSLAVLDGASEIDIVLSVGKLFEKKYEEIIEEIHEIKSACRSAHLKVILESGALKVDEIRVASILSMESGADFIKTSTGKQVPAATTTAAYIMCKLIKEYYDKTGRKVGFKAAGGIATTEEALDYYCIVEEVLGAEWLKKEFFRFGASRLANNILTDIMETPTTAF